MPRSRKRPSVSAAYEDLRADFRASKNSRFTPRLRGVDSLGSGADYHYRFHREYYHMMERARDYERNDMIVGAGLNRLTANVLQDGFSPDPQTGSKELDERLKERWRRWATQPDECHSEGEFTWYQLERLAFRSIIRDGDIFLLLQESGRVQAVEAHRAKTPKNTTRDVVHGILMDKNKVRRQVWFTREDVPTGKRVQRVGEIKPYDVRDASGRRQVLQLYFPRRLSQRRGVTALAPCSDTVGQHDDLQFSTLVKAQLASLVVLLEQKSANAPLNVSGPGLRGTPEQQDEAVFGEIPGIAAGLHVRPAAGHTLSGFSPNIPNPEFFPHAMLLLTFIAVNLDLPVQVLLLDPTRTNFSGWRGAIDQARLRFREMQRDLIEQMHQPTYEWKVSQWLDDDEELRALAEADGVDAFRHTWKRPSWPYIEPLKDSQADDLQQKNFLNSPRRVQAARGRDYDEVVKEIVEDKVQLIELAIQAADELVNRYPSSGVTWREILGPGLTSQVSVVTESAQQQDNEVSA